MMAGVVPDEAELGEGQAEEAGDGEGPPGAPDQDQGGEPTAKAATVSGIIRP